MLFRSMNEREKKLQAQKMSLGPVFHGGTVPSVHFPFLRFPFQVSVVSLPGPTCGCRCVLTDLVVSMLNKIPNKIKNITARMKQKLRKE